MIVWVFLFFFGSFGICFFPESPTCNTGDDLRRRLTFTRLNETSQLLRP